MAAIRSYVNGAGGASGADLAVLENTYQSGNYWYVGNAVSGASDSNAGTERSKPLLTTAQAYTNAAAGDTVVWLASHAETITVSVNMAKAGMSWVGEGTGSAIPRLTCNAAITMLDVTAAGILIDNVYFPASTTVAPGSRLRVGAAGTILNGLSFDCGLYDTNSAFQCIVNSTVRLTDTRFTATAATPAIGLYVSGAFTDLTMDAVVFDGGSFGWSDYAWKQTAAITRAMRATRISLYNGSHVLMPTATIGTLQIENVTGDSRLDWTP